MSTDWTYFAEYYTHKNRPTQLRAVYRSRPRPGGYDDFIFTKNGWRPTRTLVGIRVGRGDHDAVQIPEDEADRLTDEIRRERVELLRRGVVELVGILREHGMPERAAEIMDTYDSLSGGPHVEGHLYDLVTETSVPAAVRDEDTIVRYNRAQEIVQQMTQESQR